MPCYKIQVGNKNIVCEMPDVVLADDEAARAYAIEFCSNLFNSHYELCSGQWHLCSVHVLTEANEQISAMTLADAALIERDYLRLQRKASVNH